MEYKGVRYELLEVVNPFGWKWIVQLGATKTAGFSRSKYVADFAAKRAIDKGLNEEGDEGEKPT